MCFWFYVIKLIQSTLRNNVFWNIFFYIDTLNDAQRSSNEYQISIHMLFTFYQYLNNIGNNFNILEKSSFNFPISLRFPVLAWSSSQNQFAYNQLYFGGSSYYAQNETWDERECKWRPTIHSYHPSQND